MTFPTKLSSAIVLVLAAAGSVHAHPGHGATDMSSGLAHPLTGFDHLLAMVAVGLCAAVVKRQAKRRVRKLEAWEMPAIFIVALIAGAMGGMSGFSLPVAEFAVALSVVCLGALVIMAERISRPVAMSLVAAAGLAHGYVHGIESPTGGALAFLAGVVVMSAVLHATGIFIARSALRANGESWLRMSGAGICAAGLVLCIF